mmetsp:Transcript_11372/g.26386  ORF Transcript_11372/g.26386 Transcript_11372/m.26386 type:complete len:85 (-) Transcript_11372:945-1199(-)
MWSLPTTPEAHAQITHGEGMKTIVNGMMYHASNVTVQLEALKAIKLLAPESNHKTALFQCGGERMPSSIVCGSILTRPASWRRL